MRVLALIEENKAEIFWGIITSLNENRIKRRICREFTVYASFFATIIMYFMDSLC